MGLSAFALLVSCESGKKPESRSRSERLSSSPSRASVPEISGNQGLFTYSFRNDPMQSPRVNRVQAETLIAQLEGRAKSLDDLSALLAAQGLANSSVRDLLGTGRKIAGQVLKRSIQAKVPETIRLTMAISAMHARNFDLAEFYLADLKSAKNPRIRAAIANVQGVIFLNDGRLPEAMTEWRKALKALPSFLPARLNLGFVALKYGDTNLAGKTLPSQNADWYVQSGRLVTARFRGAANQTDRLCKQILSQKPRHKPTVYNCGVYQLEERKNFAEARKLISTALKLPGGGEEWEEAAYKLLTVIETKEQEILLKKRAQQEQAAEARRAQEQKRQAAQQAARQKAQEQGQSQPKAAAQPKKP